MTPIRCSPAVLALVVLGAVWWLAIELWPELPPRIPMKFDLGGHPVRYAESTGGEWFALPAIATLITAFLVALGPVTAWLARENPEFINIPSKERFLASPAARRVALIAPLGRAIAWIAVLTNALFGWILLGIQRVGSGEWETISAWPLAAFFTSLAAVLIPAFLRTRRAMASEGVAES